MRVLFGFLNRIETLQRGKVIDNPNRDQPHGKRIPPARFIICHCRRDSFCLLFCVLLLIDLHVHTFKKP
nr:MAG TPA: trypsin [Caudoviricetes sp.]